MSISDFFKELIAPHVKNMEAEHKYDIKDLDILSSITIIEKNNEIEIDVNKIPSLIGDQLKSVVTERSKFLSFGIKMINH